MDMAHAFAELQHNYAAAGLEHAESLVLLPDREATERQSSSCAKVKLLILDDWALKPFLTSRHLLETV